jgi:hypothetical protein
LIGLNLFTLVPQTQIQDKFERLRQFVDKNGRYMVNFFEPIQAREGVGFAQVLL